MESKNIDIKVLLSNYKSLSKQFTYLLSERQLKTKPTFELLLLDFRFQIWIQIVV